MIATKLSAKLREGLAQIQYWPRTLRLIWTAAPRWTVAWAVLLIVQGFLPMAAVYLTKLFVDSLVAALRSDHTADQVRHSLVLLVIAAGVMLLTEVLQSLIDWIRTAQSELMQDYIKDLIHKQSVDVDLAFYESAEYHDRLEQARSEASSRSLMLLEGAGSLIQNGMTFFAMAVLLIPYSPWLTVVLIASTLPALYVVLRYDFAYHRWWQETTPERRWTNYYDMNLTVAAAAAEIRLFGLGSHFQSAYQKLRRGLRTGRLDHVRRQSVATLGAGAVAVVVSAAAMAWMMWRALNGAATLGDLALLYLAFNRGQGLVRSLLSSAGHIYTNSLFLGNLFAFLDLKPSINDPASPIPVPETLTAGIAFKHVTFRYPGSARAALDDFNLFVPAGKVVALVGVNGAGKTTLLKLLCRFYDPEAGGIEMDGKDLRALCVEELRRHITVLFQFPLQCQATAGQAIAMGDLRTEQSASQIEAAARGAGAHDLISGLPEGYETLLGKWFADGVELSGGEWQRIAMARAYLRQSPIIVLDEPTSFMDSWSEADWFDRFRDLAEGRTAIVITHRFTVAMRADVIHVMERGRIVESGTHHQLLAQGGRYAQSWLTQMKGNGGPVSRTSQPHLDEELALHDLELR